MQGTILSVQPRLETGKGPTRRLRKEGLIPAVVYGHSEPVSISIDERIFYKTFHAISESTIITLEIDGKDVDVLIKDYDEDILTGRIRHIDFFEIERGKKLRTHVSITVEGSAIGVREGGIMEHSLYDVEIECLPKDIPEHLTVDVSSLALGESIHVSDLLVPEGVRILNNPDQTVLVIAAPRAVVEEEAVEEEVGEEEGTEESESSEEE